MYVLFAQGSVYTAKSKLRTLNDEYTLQQQVATSGLQQQ